MDNVLAAELIDVLDKQAAIYEAILEISKSKTDIVIQGKVSELESLVKMEQSLVLKMGKLEGRREQLVEKLSEQLSVKPSEITLSKLYEVFQHEDSEKLKKVHGKLSNVLSDLKESNSVNSKLIKNSLDYIDFSINLLAGLNTVRDNSYNSLGKTGLAEKRSLFDVKL